MSESEDEKRERLERPFGRCMRDLCKELGITAGLIASRAAHDKTQPATGNTAKLSKSTVVDMLDGTTWAPRNEETLSRLVRAMRLDQAQEARLHAAAHRGAEARAEKAQQSVEKKQTNRAKVAEGHVESSDDASPASGPPTTATSTPRTRIRHLVGWVIALLAAALVTVLVVLLVSGPGGTEVPRVQSAPAASSCPPPPAPALSRATVSQKTPQARFYTAVVVNTWSSSQCRDVGVVPRVSPLRSKTEWPGYHTGDSVTVSCYYPQGLPATDKDTREVSTTWYKLDDGRYLSALFLRVQGQPGTEPPPELANCAGVR